MEDWNVAKPKLKEKLSKLIGNDFAGLEDQQALLIQRLEKRLGKTREAILKLLSEL